MTEFQAAFQGKVRVRVCGLLQEAGKILLLRHHGVGPAGHLWSPPGGGLEFGESVEDALVREFEEETGLQVQIVDFLFTNEYRDDSLHAIELFFSVKVKSGNAALGKDPELAADQQILTDMHFFTPDELHSLHQSELHNAFRYCDHPLDIFDLRGFFKFENISK